MTGSWLILETSGRVGQVGLARAGAVVRMVLLDDRRRHARDLAATVSSVLDAESLRPVDLTGIVVGRGPGSYTGLRIGLMSAKALTYALDCELRAVETFAAIAVQAPVEAQSVWVIADALQGQVYAQPYTREENSWQPTSDLRIESVDDWSARLRSGDWVSGPGVAEYRKRIPRIGSIVPDADCEPRIESIFRVGMRTRMLARAEVFALEPLYLRGSSAEERKTSEPCR
jgi:tRNA threonylcarbamoyladenosine biosynthesis protein TsaB